MSPEQALNEPLGPASDIYSLGLVLIECFAREVAFPGTPVVSAVARMTRDPEIPPWVDARLAPILASMTLREPAGRPSAGALIEALRAALRASRD